MKKPLEHGTTRAYQVYKCRCADCRSANNEYIKKYLKNKDLSSISHGSLTSYKSYGCRCDECKAVHAIWKKQYRLKNLERESEYGKKWRAENMDKKREEKYRRRTLERKARHGCVNKQKIEEIALFNNHSCAYCGGPYEHIDHIIPYALGGMDCVENITIACAKCNLSKGSKPLSEWRDDTVEVKTLVCTLGDSNGK